MSIQVVGRTCALCEQRIRSAQGAEGCDACDLAFHVACVAAATASGRDGPFREAAGAERRVGCPRCGKDPREARAANEKRESDALAASLAIGGRRFRIARVVGVVAIVPVVLGMIALLAMGMRRLYLFWLLVPLFAVRRLFGVSRAVAQALAFASALWTAALAVIAWTLLEGDRAGLGVGAAMLSAGLATNAWVLFRDPHIRAYVAHEEHAQRAQREESTSR